MVSGIATNVFRRVTSTDVTYQSHGNAGIECTLALIDQDTVEKKACLILHKGVTVRAVDAEYCNEHASAKSIERYADVLGYIVSQFLIEIEYEGYIDVASSIFIICRCTFVVPAQVGIKAMKAVLD